MMHGHGDDVKEAAAERHGYMSSSGWLLHLLPARHGVHLIIVNNITT
jgi:hypothetical protein